MSRFEIKMPKLGESITEGTIISWSVKWVILSKRTMSCSK